MRRSRGAGGGGVGYPDPEIRGRGSVSKFFFRPFGPQFGLKIREAPSPDPPLSRNPNCFQMFLKMYAMQMACFTDLNTKIVKQCLVSRGGNAPLKNLKLN